METSRQGAAVSGRPADLPRDLTPRQIECLLWAQQGKSARDTGQILGISGRTVEKVLAQAYEKLGVRTRIQAVVRARELGLIGNGDADVRAPQEPRRVSRG